MNKLLKFLENFFQAELEAKHSCTFKNIQNQNEKVDYLNTFLISELHNSFVAKFKALKSEVFYKTVEGSIKPAPRHLFKLSHYKHEKYGDLYLAYVSNDNPDSEYGLKYFECLFITKIEGEYKIIQSCFIADHEIENSEYWSKGSVYGGINLETAGEFISCERYLEPSRCEFSMQDYLQDK